MEKGQGYMAGKICIMIKCIFKYHVILLRNHNLWNLA